MPSRSVQFSSKALSSARVAVSCAQACPSLTPSGVPVVLGALLFAQSFDEPVYRRLVHFKWAGLLFDHVKLSLQRDGADSGCVDAVSLAVQAFVQLVRDADVSPGHDPSFTREASRLAGVCMLRNIHIRTYAGWWLERPVESVLLEQLDRRGDQETAIRRASGSRL